jgi:hypothetical protein
MVEVEIVTRLMSAVDGGSGQLHASGDVCVGWVENPGILWVGGWACCGVEALSQVHTCATMYRNSLVTRFRHVQQEPHSMHRREPAGSVGCSIDITLLFAKGLAVNGTTASDNTRVRVVARSAH